MKRKKKEPDLILREGKPAAVILDIDRYQDMLERLEDLEDLRELEEMRKKPRFKDFDLVWLPGEWRFRAVEVLRPPLDDFAPATQDSCSSKEHCLISNEIAESL